MAAGGGTKNIDSARVSVQAQFVKDSNGKLRWRNDLLKTEPFWRGFRCCT